MVTRESHPTQNPSHLLADDLSNGYLVSTIRRPETLRELDGMIGMLKSMIDPDNELDRADLTTPGDFETMVFRMVGGEVIDWAELDFRRYVTEAEARAGHEEVVEKWMAVAE